MLRTSVGCLLLFAVAAARVQASAPAPDDKVAGQALEIQKKLGERIPTYGLKIQTTLDRALEDLLGSQGVEWMVNEGAFGHAGIDKPGDILKTTQIDPFEVKNLPRAAVLKRLLSRIPSTSEKGMATYVIRRDGVEVTTRESYQAEFFPNEDLENWSTLPPLVCAELNETPLSDAVKELARNGECNILVDGRIATEAKTKVSADLVAVPVETAVRLLADQAGVKLVRLGNVYYVTSKENACTLQREEDKARLEKRKHDEERDKQPQFGPPPLSGPGPLPEKKEHR